jgi:hypothetical protein
MDTKIRNDLSVLSFVSIVPFVVKMEALRIPTEARLDRSGL